MNITHRSIWNAALGAWVAVSEITRACGKRSGAAVALVLAGASVCSSVAAQNYPIDGGSSETVPGGSPRTINGWLIVGDAGQGTLAVSGGGTISDIVGIVGFQAGSTGTATVAGPGSSWSNTSKFSVGHTGIGTVTVSGGGTISNTSGFLGESTGTGSVTVTGAGSIWSNSAVLQVGQIGTGTLSVLNGGKVFSNFGYVGGDPGSVGNATVSGAGATWTSGPLFVGSGGSGTLTVQAGGHVAATGALWLGQYAGSTGVLNIGAEVGNPAAAAGTVAASEVRFGAGTGSLNFNHTETAYTFGMPITGAGVLNHYAGTTLLTGTNTYTGATTINGGTLRVNGSIANSAVTVNSGATLGGSGTVGTTTIASGGIFAPGNSIGTIAVNGNLSFAAGSTYRIEVDAAGNNDRINVTGSAALNGTVDVQAGAGSFQANTQYTILNATGGVTGTFSGVTSNLAFLTPTLSYDPNNVFLALARNGAGFASVANTPNQQASATALQAVASGASGDLATVVDTVTGLSASQARSAYDAISGASLVALRRAGAAFADGFGQQMNQRLGVVAPGHATRQASTFGAPLLLAANDWQADGQRVAQAGMGAALDSAQQRPDGRGFWLRGYGTGSETDSDGNAAANSLRGGGISAGFDTEVREGLVLGAALSSGASRVAFSSSADAGRSRGSALGVYGSYTAGPWAFKGSASLASHANHMDRAVTVGPLARTASSDFDGRSQSLYAEATYDIPQAGYLLQPLAALSYVRTQADGFTETGAGALNLQVAEQTTTSTRSLLGAKTVHEVGSLKIEPRLLWAHEFGNVNAPLSASFTGAPAAGSFQVSGVALKRDSLVLGLGVSGQLRKGLTLVADGQLEGSSSQRNLAVFVGVRGVW